MYMAPEILNRERYSSKVDLWSLGCILYEMACGKHPFETSNKLVFPNDRKLSEDIKSLITRLLERNQNRRIDYKTFFGLPIVKQARKDAESVVKEYTPSLGSGSDYLDSINDSLNKLDLE